MGDFTGADQRPDPDITAKGVLRSILKSSPSDQLSMYFRSRFIHSSKHTSFRYEVICHRQVKPSFMERRLRCQLSYFSTSDGIGGLGPTMLISPFRTLINCGNSSMLVLRRIVPIMGIIRGSFLILKTGPSDSFIAFNFFYSSSALAIQILNLYRGKDFS